MTAILETLRDAAKGKFSLAMHYPMLSKAVNNDDAPTPGYLYNEIAKITFESAEVSSELEDFLLRKVEGSNANAKLKALKVLRHTCEKGHSAFRQSLSRRTDAIRDAMNYRGIPDPILGDAPYRLVREAAAALIETIFDTSAERNTSYAPSSLGSQGMGSSRSDYERDGYGHSVGGMRTPYGPPAAPPPSSSHGDGLQWTPGRKMEGFGNTASDGGASSGSIYDKLKGRLSSSSSSGAHNNSSLLGSDSSYKGAEAYYGEPHGADSFHDAAYGTAARQQQWPPSSSSAGAAWTSAPAEAKAPGHEELRPASDGTYEARIVSDITAPGGVRATPAREDLAAFVKRCSTLDVARVVALLGEVVVSAESTQSCQKALSVIEALLRSDLPNISTLLHSIRDSIKTASLSPTQTVRDKASKILLILGDPPSTTTQTPRYDMFQQRYLGDNLERAQYQPPQMSAGSNYAPSRNADSRTAAPLVSLTDSPAAQHQPQQSQSLFAGMALHGQSAQQRPSAPTAQPMASQPQSQPQPTQAPGLFSGMTLSQGASAGAPAPARTAGQQVVAPAQRAPAQQASLISFDTDEAAPAQNGAVSTDDVGLDSFDPLRGTSAPQPQAAAAAATPTVQQAVPASGVQASAAPRTSQGSFSGSFAAGVPTMGGVPVVAVGGMPSYVVQPAGMAGVGVYAQAYHPQGYYAQPQHGMVYGGAPMVDAFAAMSMHGGVHYAAAQQSQQPQPQMAGSQQRRTSSGAQKAPPTNDAFSFVRDEVRKGSGSAQA